MTESSHREDEVFQFILDKIDSVPHLEALLLLWNTRPQGWSEVTLAARLHVNPGVAEKLLHDLHRDELAAIAPAAPDLYCYRSESPEKDDLIGALDATYRRQLVRISTMIHGKASSAIRDFAKAFRITKEQK